MMQLRKTRISNWCNCERDFQRTENVLIFLLKSSEGLLCRCVQCCIIYRLHTVYIDFSIIDTIIIDFQMCTFDRPQVQFRFVVTQPRAIGKGLY